MTDLDSLLLRAILDNPDDDAARLAYSDLLEECGQPGRAEFIRLQCRLAAFPPCPRSHFPGEYQGGMCLACQGEAAPLRRREGELLDCSPAFSWTGAPQVPWAGMRVTPDPILEQYGAVAYFRRGFVERIACAWADWSGHAAAVLAATPVCEVTLTTWPRLVLSGAPGATIYRLPGFPAIVTVTLDADASEHRAVTAPLLTAAWPGIRFELPPVSAAS